MMWMFGGKKYQDCAFLFLRTARTGKSQGGKCTQFLSVGKVLEGAVWGWGEQGVFNLFTCLA